MGRMTGRVSRAEKVEKVKIFLRGSFRREKKSFRRLFFYKFLNDKISFSKLLLSTQALGLSLYSNTDII